MNRRKFLKGAASVALGVAAARLGIGKADAVGHGTGGRLWIGETEVEGPWTVELDGALRSSASWWCEPMSRREKAEAWEARMDRAVKEYEKWLDKREWGARGGPVTTWFLDSDGEIEERVTTYRGLGVIDNLGMTIELEDTR